MMPLIKQFEHLIVQLEAIKLATNNFADDHCIGKGGFGKVYKGELLHSKGRAVVAIKRLDRSFGQGNSEFWREIIMLSQYKHENIVSLLGFCDQSDEKILVYEFASKGSLDLHLNSVSLTWTQRLKISIAAARGLAYLHYPGTTQQRVLHRDIKSSNILLDENWDAKIADLGLSKFGPANQKYTFLVSNVVGTIGYMDPVYLETGFLTKESDVYSFGVVLFEILCGRLSIGNNNSDRLRPLTDLVRQYYEENRINEIVYGDIQNEINPISLKLFTTIAYQCLKKDHEERPLMAEVVSKLEEALACQLGILQDSVHQAELNPLDQYFNGLKVEETEDFSQQGCQIQNQWALARAPLGEEPLDMNINDLQKLENQLEMRLRSLRIKKDQILWDEIQELSRKRSLIHRENLELYEKACLIRRENQELHKQVYSSTDMHLDDNELYPPLPLMPTITITENLLTN